MSEFVCVILVAAALLSFFLGYSIEHHAWLHTFTEKPYCESDSAEVAGKKIELKRCWKVIEVEP